MPGYKIKTRSWGEIEEFYSELISKHKWKIKPMLGLIREIQDMGYGKFLYPATSHATLLIGKTKDYHSSDSEIRIDWDERQRLFRLKYFQSELSKPWEIEFEESEIRDRMNRIFLKRLRWFKKTGPSNI